MGIKPLRGGCKLRSASTMFISGASGKFGIWQWRKCLICRYLKKWEFGRLNFPTSCSNDTKILSLSAQYPIFAILEMLDPVRKAENDDWLEWNLKGKKHESRSVSWTEPTLSVCARHLDYLWVYLVEESEDPRRAGMERFLAEPNSIVTHEGQSARLWKYDQNLRQQILAIRQCYAFTSFRLWRWTLCSQGRLPFHMWDDITEYNVSKKDLGMKVDTDWKMNKNLARIFILIQLIRPTKDVERGDHHCVRHHLVWFNRVRKFSL